MALQDRQDQETTALKGVNLATYSTKIELGRFTRLTNFIPSKLNELKKKRGVQNLTARSGQYIPPITVSIPVPCNSVGPLLTFNPDLNCPNSQFAEATMGSPALGINDLARGPMIRITDTSIATAAIGIAAVYVPKDSKIALTRWNGGSVSDLSHVIATQSGVTLIPGDVLKVRADSVNDQLYIVSVNGVDTISGTDAVVNPLNDGVGFVVLATNAPSYTNP